MNLKALIRLLKTSPLLVPVLAGIDAVLWLVDRLAILTAGRPAGKAPSLLVIRLDVLGDYLLFRPYLRMLKTRAPFEGHRLILLGNEAFRPLAEAFDADVLDGAIWVDIYKLTTRPLYRFRVVRQLRRQGFSAVFCPTVSRVLVLDDFLAAATGAPVRIGCRTDFVNSKRWEARLGDRLYTRLLPRPEGILFEMERNRRLMEMLSGQSLALPKPDLPERLARPLALPDRFVILSLGAGQDFRIWPTERFAAVVRQLRREFPGYRIVLTGTASEQAYARRLQQEVPEEHDRITDLTGRLSIPELVYALRKAALLLTNETGIVHLAAACGTPALVISQGKSLVRWHPYPAGLADRITYLYPTYIEQNRHRLAEIAPEFNPESRFGMDEISVERVWQAVSGKLLQAV
ncbi:glycosyltransferase family 9 protein [Tellurirhabdus rosea]|uniref:glycosyltransferase family 9 protein n=1 Tax=Tellurirhabdus rosea TaxID=2674997 RepID=UPI0022507E0F|nr:glycosyltransferase family 9 protein [Tellurirhabdus rosea]